MPEAPNSGPTHTDRFGGRSEERRPRTGDELTDHNVRTIIELERQTKASLTVGQRVAAQVAAFFGSTTFVLIHVAWFGVWIFVNTSSLFADHPDPFPFTFLSFMVSLEVIFLSAFILNSQNQETRLTEQRSHLDLQINLLIEQENTRMLKILRSIAVKVGADIDTDVDHLAMEESTRPERLLDQIEKATAAVRGNT